MKGFSKAQKYTDKRSKATSQCQDVSVIQFKDFGLALYFSSFPVHPVIQSRGINKMLLRDLNF